MRVQFSPTPPEIVEALNTCMENAKSKISTEYDGQRRMLYEKMCVVCAQPFWIPKHRYAQSTCSSMCSGKTQRNRASITCTNCKQEFERPVNKLVKAKHGHYFCSRSCKDAAQKLNGSCPDIRPSHFGTAKISDYRNLVSIEKCETCGIEETYLLVVHHIDGNRENNCIENLKVLCYNCHARHHLVEVGGKWRYRTNALTPAEKLTEILAIRGE